MNNKEIIAELKQRFKKGILNVREERHSYALKKKETLSYWVTIDAALLHDIMSRICEMNYPFLSVISGRDSGETIELTYHMYLSPKKGAPDEGLHLRVAVPKNDPGIPTITDLIPGALISELEKQEMLGVRVNGIGEERTFLPEKHPKGDYPWRRENLDKVPQVQRGGKNA